ncbi:peptide deformylase [Blattabacterium cuenoti]|uniref:peptide deformylase n=1 Tax=Blattabacterium cuenoti TaxID=1653831 RepID=UPI00163D031F|nr:peptide deformylase [Blattabacterium cuenoti]
MILPLVFYGNPILRTKCIEIDISSRLEIDNLVKNMFETIIEVKGIGLAAPQIGKNIRLFIVKIPLLNNNIIHYYSEVFINAKIIKLKGKKYNFKEGCLSIPGIVECVKRKSEIIIEYYNKNWNKKKKILNGLFARVIQHEYDHIEGKLFIDYLSIKKKQIIVNKLSNFIK